jgi:MFS family permease
MTTGAPIVGGESRETRAIVLAGGIVLALAFGVRAVFGGIVEPLSNDLFGGRIDIFSFSIALQNLVWGLAQPGFGLIADTYGDRRALWLGFLCYVAGMAISIVGTIPAAQHIGAGVFVGMGVSGTAFGVVLAVVGRAAPEDMRSHYLGITSALGSVGQAVLPLTVSWLVEWLDWRMTLVVVTCALAPMALCIPFLHARVSPTTRGAAGVSVAQTVRNAFGHSSYTLLMSDKHPDRHRQASWPVAAGDVRA